MHEAPWLAPPVTPPKHVHPPRPGGVMPAASPPTFPSDLPPDLRPREKAQEYPWDDWFDMVADAGDYFDLEPGKHFAAHLKPENFRKQVAAKARQRDVAIKTELLRGKGGVIRMKGVRSRAAVQRQVEYKWDLWLNGERHNLVRTLDFHVSEQTMVVNIHSAARRRGLRVRTTVRLGGIWLQAFPRVESETETP